MSNPVSARISYHTVNGQIRSACNATAGSKIEFLRDALGSVVRTTNSNSPTGTSRRYAPYGTLLSSTNGWPDHRMGWIGSWGYKRTNLNHAEEYVRARHYTSTEGRWTSVDPLWPTQLAYVYVGSNPIRLADPSGLAQVYFQACAFILGSRANPLFKPFMNLQSGFLLWDTLIGLNTNDREFGQDPLHCKMLIQVEIDSCSIGEAAPKVFGNAGRSNIAELVVPFHPLIVSSNMGSVVAPYSSGKLGKCSSYADVSARGHAGLPLGLHLPKAIQLDFRVVFSGARNNVTATFFVTNRTVFPDFEFRFGTGGLRKVWPQRGEASGPENGLLFTTSGPFGSYSLPAPTRKCCKGNC